MICMGWTCDKCKKSTDNISKHEGDRRWLCQNCYKNDYMRINISKEELKAVEIVEREIKKGLKIKETFEVVSKELSIPLSQCNSRYYAKWRFALSKETKKNLNYRKSNKQMENCYNKLS